MNIIYGKVRASGLSLCSRGRTGQAALMVPKRPTKRIFSGEAMGVWGCTALHRKA
jgi:hypothetical protein